MAEKQHEEDINLEEVYGKSEKFIQDNSKPLSIGVGVLIAIVAVVFYYFNMYLPPMEEEAQANMYAAQRYFKADSFQLAMYGDAKGNLGFEQVVQEYGSTKAGNAAKYYMGVSLLRTGAYEDAIAYFKAYNAEDAMTGAIALGATGDAFAELGDYESALDYYTKAATANDNEFTAPIYLMKAGNMAEKLNKYNEALRHYETIEDNYPLSQEGRNIKKYIARAEAYAG